MNSKSDDQLGNEKYQKIEWNKEDMYTGFPEVDAQHKEWISRFNEFTDAVINQKGEKAWTDTLLFFLRYTETHFSFEEALMKDYHCITEELNKKQHKEFRSRLEEIMAMTWPKGPTLDECIMLQRELADWLVRHIHTIDRQLLYVDKIP